MPLPPEPSSKLDIIVTRDEDLDYISLLPMFSSVETEESDLTNLKVHLSEVEVINHDTAPTEIQGLWPSIWDPVLRTFLTPSHVHEEVVTGNRRIEARSRQRFSLEYSAVFGERIPRDGSRKVMLRAKAIGLGEHQITLEDYFWYPTIGQSRNPTLAIDPSGALSTPDRASRLLRVFLCHSSDDKPAVLELYSRLRRDGFFPWLDEEDILAGQEWDLEIRKALKVADVVLACLSRESVSKTGYVQREISLALDMAEEQPEGAIYIIPVKLEECNVPNRLSKWQWVNLFENEGYERLLRTLRARAEALEA